MLFSGTSVVTGRAKAIVVATALDTELGQIANTINNTKETKSPLTIRTEKFSKQISLIIILVAIITTIVLIVKDYAWNEIFLCVIALSVSAMPEGLPLALTLALTIGANRMSKRNVIVKKLNSVAKKISQTTSALNHIFDNVMFDCSTCNLKEICDEVDGLKELHLKTVKK